MFLLKIAASYSSHYYVFKVRKLKVSDLVTDIYFSPISLSTILYDIITILT